jgi:hypothetical protein
VAPQEVTPLWIPSGLALASILVFGWQTSFGIFAGAFLFSWASMSGAAALPVSVAIATGTTVQAWLAAWLIWRMVKVLPPASVRDTLRVIGLLVPVSVISPIVRVTSLCLAGLEPWSDYLTLLEMWWLARLIGILLFAPLLVVFSMRWRKKKMAEPLLWPLTCLILGLALLTFWVFQNLEKQRVSQNMQRDAAEMTAALQNQVEAEFQRLSAIRAFYYSSQEVAPDEFASFTAPLLIASSASSGYEWVPRVTQAERSTYEQAFHERGYPDFYIYEKDSQGKKLPAADRAEYFPVTLINPFLPNQAAFGLNLGSNPERMAMIAQARDCDCLAATAPIRLVQDTGDQTGILFALPFIGERNLARRWMRGAPT